MAPYTMPVSNEIKGRVELDSVVSCDAIGCIETGWFLYISFYLGNDFVAKIATRVDYRLYIGC
jgi:hypothetical protein